MSDRHQLASPWRRLGAHVFECLLLTAGFLGLAWWVVVSTDISQFLTSLLYALLILFSVSLVGYLVYSAAMTSLFGGPLGKLVFGIEVVDDTGRRLTFWRAVWRQWFGYMLSGIFLWLGFIWILVDKHRQGWHDMITGSSVIVKRRGGAVVGTIALLLASGVVAWLALRVADSVQALLPLFQMMLPQ